MFRVRLAAAALFPALFALTGAAAPVAAQTAIDPVAVARQDSIRRPYTRADIDFMTGMIAHHAQAVVMANQAGSHGASRSVATYAARVVRAQSAEIGLMQSWLEARNQQVPDANPNGMTMRMGGESMTMLMPGMLTRDQMTLLDKARGPTWDRLFLTFMIQHHQGAIEMVDQLFHTDGAAQDEFTFKFANDVQADQTTEINRMKEMLSAMAEGD